MGEDSGINESNGNKDPAKSDADLDRKVIDCKTCGLVQYRTRVGNCRRCLRLLPIKAEFLRSPGEQLPGDDRQLFERWPNFQTVENIGRRIWQLRESRGITPNELQARSRVSRSFLSRIESGEMTPSLGTLEKLSEALGVGLNCFFVPMSNGEALLEDPFIRGLTPFLRRLGWEQWQSILERVAAISMHATASDAQLRPLGQPQSAQTDGMTRHPAAMSQR